MPYNSSAFGEVPVNDKCQLFRRLCEKLPAPILRVTFEADAGYARNDDSRAILPIESLFPETCLQVVISDFFNTMLAPAA